MTTTTPCACGVIVYNHPSIDVCEGVTTIEQVKDAFDTLRRMGGAAPAWKRANRIARTYALQNDITIHETIEQARTT